MFNSVFKIYDQSSFDDLIGNYCGTKLPNNGSITTTRNTVLLEYHSRSFSADRGFSLSWTSLKLPCGGKVNATSFGIIKSPDYPKNYTQNEDCYWKVVAPPGKRIQFNSFLLHMESHPDCTYDYLKVCV